MLGVFSLIFGLARAYRPRLALVVIFAQIVLDIFCVSRERQLISDG